MLSAFCHLGHLVIPLASLSHRSQEYYGEAATVFDGFRWVDKNQPAAMVSPAYFPFGLNRWACPGRVLAVAGQCLLLRTYANATNNVDRDEDYHLHSSGSLSSGSRGWKIHNC